jgi:quinoprotein glucose dehydrogenase
MKITPLRTISLAFVAFVAVSFLGGSGVWSVLGLAPDLTIEGEAPIVRPVPNGAGEAWASYGGDKGGGANWGSTAYDPARKTGEERPVGTLSDSAEYAPMQGAPYGMTRGVMMSPLGLPCTPPPWGVIAGISLNMGEIVWRQTIGTSQDLAPDGLALKTGTPNIGDPMITSSGLVFIGATMDDYLRAFDVSTGRELWKGRLPAGGQATPMSSEYDGRQYVVILAGGHSSLGTKQRYTLVAFALPD